MQALQPGFVLPSTSWCVSTLSQLKPLISDIPTVYIGNKSKFVKPLFRLNFCMSMRAAKQKEEKNLQLSKKMLISQFGFIPFQLLKLCFSQCQAELSRAKPLKLDMKSSSLKQAQAAQYSLLCGHNYTSISLYGEWYSNQISQTASSCSAISEIQCSEKYLICNGVWNVL